MKRVDPAKNPSFGVGVGTGLALICLLSPVVAQEAGDGGEAQEPPTVVEVAEDGAEVAEDEESIEQTAAGVLKQAPQMEVGQLEEMVQVFQRLGNTEMVEELSKVLLEKDPDNTVAASAAAGETPEPVEDAPEVATPPSAVDLAASRATKAVAAGRHDEAVAIFRRLKASEFRGKSFPYQQDLAYALLESGQVEAASDAFQGASKRPGTVPRGPRRCRGTAGRPQGPDREKACHFDAG